MKAKLTSRKSAAAKKSTKPKSRKRVASAKTKPAGSKTSRDYLGWSGKSLSSLEDQPGKLVEFLEAVAGNATRRAAEQAVRMKLPNVVMENNTLYKVYADGRREVLKAKVTSDYFVPQAARASRKNGSRKK